MSANGKGAYNRPCSGFMHREGLCLYAYGKRVRILTREESKRRNAALPIPKNYTASVIAVCGGFPRLPSSASSLPACRI